MFSKSALLAFVFLSNYVAEGKQNAPIPENKTRGLSISEFMKAFDHSASNIRGNKAGRTLQRVLKRWNRRSSHCANQATELTSREKVVPHSLIVELTSY